MFSYFKATQRRVGFLVNFGQEWVVDERFVFDEKPFLLDEHWEDVTGRISGNDRDDLVFARQCLIEVGQHNGFGYGDFTYRKLLAAVVEHHGQTVQFDPFIEPKFHQEQLGHFKSDCQLLRGNIVVVVTALKEGLERLDLCRARSYLTNLGLPFGVVANFAKDRLQLHGVAGGSHR